MRTACTAIAATLVAWIAVSLGVLLIPFGLPLIYAAVLAARLIVRLLRGRTDDALRRLCVMVTSALGIVATLFGIAVVYEKVGPDRAGELRLWLVAGAIVATAAIAFWAFMRFDRITVREARSSFRWSIISTRS